MKLDVFDTRRKGIFSDATCGDCDNWLHDSCDCEGFLQTELRRAMLEAAPDIYIPGVCVQPERNDRANLCPHFWPSWEYRDRKSVDEELNRRAEDDAQRIYTAVAHRGYAAW